MWVCRVCLSYEMFSPHFAVSMSVEVGVAVFDKCFFRYQTSLSESEKATEALSHGVRYSTRREIQNIKPGRCSFRSSDVFPSN